MRLDDFLEKFGIPFEQLTIAERDTLTEMYSSVQESQLTPEKLKFHISMMKVSVENELANPNVDKNQEIFLKARLRNYLLFEAFFMSPDRAKAALEAALSNYKIKDL